MTEQPQEYGVVAPTQRQALRRVYRDLLDRPLVGSVIVRNDQDQSIDVPVVDGAIDVALPPGRYRLLAPLVDVDGRTQYFAETVTL